MGKTINIKNKVQLFLQKYHLSINRCGFLENCWCYHNDWEWKIGSQNIRNQLICCNIPLKFIEITSALTFSLSVCFNCCFFLFIFGSWFSLFCLQKRKLRIYVWSLNDVLLLLCIILINSVCRCWFYFQFSLVCCWCTVFQQRERKSFTQKTLTLVGVCCCCYFFSLQFQVKISIFNRRINKLKQMDISYMSE